MFIHLFRQVSIPNIYFGSFDSDTMQIKINGGIKADIPDNNSGYDMLHDYTQEANGFNSHVVGDENSDPSNKLYMMVANDI